MFKIFSSLMISFLIFVSNSANAFQYNLSICVKFQNEAPYLKEWIDYHRLVGVQHFWLYNDKSQDDYQSVLKPYIEEGVVELIQWPAVPREYESAWNCHLRSQIESCNDAIQRARNVSKWLAAIDVDEFILPVVEDNIAECLEKRYSQYGGVRINWVCFGTAGVEKVPDGAYMTDYLVKRSSFSNGCNLFIKSIVQPLYTDYNIIVHTFKFLPGYCDVTTDYGVPIQENWWSKSCLTDILRINHYWSRDEWFLNNVRVPNYTQRFGIMAKDSLLKQADSYNVEYDYTLKNKFQALREAKKQKEEK